MRHMTFAINGVDLSALCDQYGFSSGMTPVYSAEVETMDRKRHSTLVRWRGWCSVKLNDVSDDEARRFCAALMSAALNVSYYNAHLGAQVTQEMTVDSPQLGYLLQDVSGRYWSGSTLQFEER